MPEALIPPAGARVMSLVDGTAKMSKSAEAEGSRINLTDTPDEIAKKIKRCKVYTPLPLPVHVLRAGKC